MTERHIERFFRDASPDGDFPWAWEWESGFAELGRARVLARWDDVLAEDLACIFLEAPTRSGKSTELRHFCQSHPAHAVYTTAALFIDGDARGTAAPWVFVDALDELLLRDRDFDDFRAALKARRPELAAARVLFAAREGYWSEEIRGALASLCRGEEQEPTARSSRSITFASLRPEQVREIGVEEGLADPDALVDHIRRRDILSEYALDPESTRALARAFVETGGRLGRRLLMAAQVNAGLREHNAGRQRGDGLIPPAVRAAAERLAAAVVYEDTEFIALSGGRPRAQHRVTEADALMADWGGRELAQLFQRPLFAAKGASHYQFRRRVLTDYLAACWVLERKRLRPESWAALDLLTLSPNGGAGDKGTRVVPRAWRAALGWLATLDVDTRARLLQLDPGLLIVEGDSAELDGPTREAALRGWAIAPPSPENSSVGGGAWRERLAGWVSDALLCELLARVDVAAGRRADLLAAASLGSFPRAAAMAWELASDRASPEALRAVAVRVVRAHGDGARVAMLVDAMPAVGDGLRSEILESLDMSGLSDAAVLQALLLPGPRTGLALTKAIRTLSGPQRVAALDSLAELGTAGLVDAATIRAGDALTALLTCELSALEPPHADRQAAVIRALLQLHREHVHYHGHASHGSREAMRVGLAAHAFARRGVWLAVSPEERRFSSSRFLRLRFPDDALWAWQLARDPSEQRRAISRMLPESGSDLGDRGWPAGLRALVGALRAENAKNADDEREREATKAAALDRHRATVAAAALDAAEGEEVAAAVQVVHVLFSSGRREISAYDAAALRGDLARLFGPTRGPKLAAWLAALWTELPLLTPAEPDGGYFVNFAVLLGGLEALSRPGAKERLSDRLIDRAVQVASLVSTPGAWLDDLHQRQPERVESACRAALQRGKLHFAQKLLPSQGGAAWRRALVLEVLPDLHLDERRHDGWFRDVFPRGVGLTGRLADAVLIDVLAGLVDGCAGDKKRWAGWAMFLCLVAPRRGLSLLRKEGSERRRAVLLELRHELEFGAHRGRGECAFTTPGNLAAWLPSLGRWNIADGDPLASDAMAVFRECTARLAADGGPEAATALDNAARRRWRRIRRREINLAQRAQSATRAAIRARALAPKPLAEEGLDQRQPETTTELADLLLRHMRAIVADACTGDLEHRSLLRKCDEREVQRWIARQIQLLARDYYSIVIEAETAGDKRPDLMALVPLGTVEAVPVEVKLFEGWSETKHATALVEQLHGQYMKPVGRHRGVYLLVRTGKKKIARRRSVDALADHLRGIVAAHAEGGRRTLDVLVLDLVDPVAG